MQVSLNWRKHIGKTLEGHAEMTKAITAHLGGDLLVQRFPKPQFKLDFV